MTNPESPYLWVNILLVILVLSPFFWGWLQRLYAKSDSAAILLLKFVAIALSAFVLLLPNIYGYYHVAISLYFSFLGVVAILGFLLPVLKRKIQI